MRQKSQIKWFQEGDYNSSYFHSVLRDKRRRLHLHKIKNHRNRWIHGDVKVVKAVVRHYEKRFNLEALILNTSPLGCIPRCISVEDNEHLVAIPDVNEVKKAVFNLNANSAAGLNGFNKIFYQTCWEIIKDDISTFVIEFFSGKFLTKFF